MSCSTSLFVKGYCKAQPLNVSLVVFPRAHELFNFAAQTPALVFLQYLYRNIVSLAGFFYPYFWGSVNNSLREIYENPIFICGAD